MATLIKNRGYTLIELVVVVGLVGILTIGMISVFLASLRGSSKAQLEAEIRAQGDYAITKMERNLRSADVAPTCVTPTDIVFSSANVAKRYYFYSESPSTILNESNTSLFGSNVTVSEVKFECFNLGGQGHGLVEISFSLAANGKMGQEVMQVFKTAVAIRSVQ